MNGRNLQNPAPDSTGSDRGTYGIRVSLPDGDPFAVLLDPDWSTTHWFDSEQERDRALHEMQREHEYSRRGDKPALVFRAIERDAGG